MLDIALEVPLGGFALGGGRQRHHAGHARREVFRETLDGPALPCGVAAFKNNHDSRPGFFNPFLEFCQFRLQTVKLGFIEFIGDLLGVLGVDFVTGEVPREVRGQGFGGVGGVVFAHLRGDPFRARAVLNPALPALTLPLG